MIYCKSKNIKLIFAPVDDHRSMGMVERLIRILKTRLSIMKIDKNISPYKIASDVAELIKTLCITPHTTTKITPFEVHYWRKPNTPLTNICTTPKISRENTNLSCLDDKILTKSALTPEAIWNRDISSEDELSVAYKSNYLPEPSFEPAGPSTQAVPSKITGRASTSQIETMKKKQVTLSDTDEDEEFDQALLKKLPIVAHLPLNNIPYDLQKVKRSFLADNPQHDIANIRTRKPIR